MCQAGQQTSIEMELVMRGIVVLSVVGTALCLISASHWRSGVARPYSIPPYVRTLALQDRQERLLRLPREVLAGEETREGVIGKDLQVKREELSNHEPKYILPKQRLVFVRPKSVLPHTQATNS